MHQAVPRQHHREIVDKLNRFVIPVTRLLGKKQAPKKGCNNDDVKGLLHQMAIWLDA
jgi:hypothetical protein